MTRPDPNVSMYAVVSVGVVADEGEGGVATPKFAVDGVNHAGAGSMNRVKFDIVQAFLQNLSP